MYKCKLSNKGHCIIGPFQNYICDGYKEGCSHYVATADIKKHFEDGHVLIEKKYFDGDIYKKAIDKYGLKSQLIKAIEELSELQKELCKVLNFGGSCEKIAEEIADVQIMIEQIKIIWNITHEKIEHIKRQKIERLKERLEKDEKI